MVTNVVKTLKFPGSDDQYQINAVRLDGHTYDEIQEQIDTLSSFDALRYMGTIAAGETAPGGFTVAANKGDVYKVISNGYVMGAKVEVGDMLICNADNTPEADADNYTAIAANWDIIQSNVDVDAILAHTHTGTVTFTKTAKTLDHTVTPTESNLTATFEDGSATVTGDHSHTASGSVTITPAGAVASHKHNVIVSASTETHTSVSEVTSKYIVEDSVKAPYDGILIIGTTTNNATYVTDVSFSESEVAPSFIGTQITSNVDVTVNDFTGNFTGNATGTVKPSLSKVVTGVTVDNHSIETVDAGTVKTGNGTQDE